MSADWHHPLSKYRGRNDYSLNYGCAEREIEAACVASCCLVLKLCAGNPPPS